MSRARDAALIVALVSGCSAAAEPPDSGAATVDEIRPGIIEYFGESADVVDAPAAVAGEPFTVTVATYGGGCEMADSLEVSLAADGAELAPYDRTYIPAGSACTTVLRRFPRTTELVFEAPGEKTLTVHGRRVATSVDAPTTVQQVVMVE
jgi:hypothetical protein